MAKNGSPATTIAVFTLAGIALLVLTLLAAWYLQSPAPSAAAAPRAGIDSVAFDAEPLSPLPQSVALDADKVALGAKLFDDPRLSRDDSIACATCHPLDHAGSDGRRTARGIGGKVGAMNTPTVFNSGFNVCQFWDGRAASLEEQAAGPVRNPAEMGSDWPEIVGKLSQDRFYRNAFGHLYAGGVSAAAVRDALATFERSLVTPDARLDRYLRGDKAALDERESRGYRLFKDLGCASCHQGINVGGNFYAGLGVFGNFFGDRGKDAPEDQGRYNVTGQETDRHRFRVPSLRNVARTAPYFHDGSVPTLEQAIRLMGKYQLGRDLSDDEIGLIAAFLETLTGNYQGRPL
ncbi:MAG: cytochrome-c peroxidase [Rhodocyclaceae bacterium]|nr:cytochrome-c peroxidase [Rhodocyclaceae bacterium]